MHDRFGGSELDWKRLEEKWQRRWAESRIFQSDVHLGEPKFFVTIAFPYPNMPFHVGHGRPYTLTDVYSRYMRMRGYNVLFPMAFHYTGTPILAIAKRVAAGEKELIAELEETYKVPPEKVPEFVVPLNIATYFRKEIKESMMALGYSVDWRREFTTIDPQFSRFVEWQFRTLRSKGLISKGSHPVGWCPNCGNPLGQHDTKGDVEPEIGEFVLVKFRLGGKVLPTGTLRSETVFGVTNLWVRPDVTYVEVAVDGERWIVSRECVAKLALKGKKATILSEVSGQSLIGLMVENPLTGVQVPILPASFVDPANATGVVMSVPAHAPYDWAALEDLKRDPKSLALHGMKPELLEKILPISLISLEGHSEFPAADVLRHFGKVDQNDPRVEAAGKSLYSEEFHRGTMKGNTGKYAGMHVSGARALVESELVASGKADRLFEMLNRPVYCRCGTEAVVKVLEDQWFINYGDSRWKEEARGCLGQMRIVPPDLRVEFENVIGWLRQKACARRQGMGTKLPWDKDWTIESLSDSVIYMAYYVLAKQIYALQIPAEKLTDAVFDYLLLGKGEVEVIAAESGVDTMTLKAMRDEFCYFYPLDSRNSGRDLVPNHLSFFIFNHASIFPSELWPKQIVVTGSVLMEGKKMSKSIGNIIPLRDAIRDFGADPFRLTILSTAELLQDADFSPSLARAQGERLERFYASAMELAKNAKNTAVPFTGLDRWLLSRMQEYVTNVTEAMDNLRFREAIHNVVYLMDQDLQWYSRRKELGQELDSASLQVLRHVLETRILLLAPFVPHLCEEVWDALGGDGFISEANWPVRDESREDLKALAGEELVKSLYEDLQSILQATKIVPKKVVFYVAAPWKWKVYLSALELAKEGRLVLSALMKLLMVDPVLRGKAREVSSFAEKVSLGLSRAQSKVVGVRLIAGQLDEGGIVSEARGFFARELKADVEVYFEDDSEKYDPKGRARLSEPLRPAIFLE